MVCPERACFHSCLKLQCGSCQMLSAGLPKRLGSQLEEEPRIHFARTGHSFFALSGTKRHPDRCRLQYKHRHGLSKALIPSCAWSERRQPVHWSPLYLSDFVSFFLSSLIPTYITTANHIKTTRPWRISSSLSAVDYVHIHQGQYIDVSLIGLTTLMWKTCFGKVC